MFMPVFQLTQGFGEQTLEMSLEYGKDKQMATQLSE